MRISDWSSDVCSSDLFHVEKIDIRPGGTREVDTIDIGADARVEVECEVVLADAADESGQHRWRTEHLRRGRSLHAGGEVRELRHIVDAFFLTGRPGKSRNGTRDRLDPLRARKGSG